MDQSQRCVDAIRVLSAEAIQAANSGHPGIALGAAPIMATLYARHLQAYAKDPAWINRDRFILSAGHGSALLYSTLHLFGYDLSMEDLRQFRQWGSKTPGHPEYGHTPGVDATTGPLGQGIAMAVGMAMAEQRLAAKLNTPQHQLIDHYTYVLSGDGCLMEGISGEAASLAGTLKLSKLIALYDCNHITIEGDTATSFSEDVAARYRAYGWNVLEVPDGEDLQAIDQAMAQAKQQQDAPTLIIVYTKIGAKSRLEGSAKTHGEPLGEENLQALKETLDYYPEQSFYVPQELRTYLQGIVEKNAAAYEQWQKQYRLAMQDCAFAANWDSYFAEPATQVDPVLLQQAPAAGKATRANSQEVLCALHRMVPSLWGGSADLAPSNKSEIPGESYFSAQDRGGQNIHFGIREHAMAAMANGMALHGGVTPYVATFLVFSDYLRHSVRLSALMRQRVLYVCTHDSIGVGEDGPTHQPIEHLASFRAMPGVTVYRPADSVETAAAYAYALSYQGPTLLALSRQNLPAYEETSFEGAQKGAYVVYGKECTSRVILATGSELALALAAAKRLACEGIPVRVVSMPCMEAFEAQDESYRRAVLPEEAKVLVVEAGTSFGWHKYADAFITIDHFGASAPAKQVFESFGFTEEAVSQAAREL